MNKELEQYQSQPEPMWDRLVLFGGDGYDVMGQAEKRGWHAIGNWGERGWNLGTWPLVIVFHKDMPEIDRYFVVEYVEGDVTCYACPTKAIREQITDSIAFFHWKFADEEWVEGIENEKDAPQSLRGPFSSTRGQA